MATQLKIINNEAVLLFDLKDEVSSLKANPKSLKKDHNTVDDVFKTLSDNDIDTVFLQIADDKFTTLLMATIYNWYKKFSDKGIKVNTSRLPKNLSDLLSLTVSQANVPPEVSSVDTGLFAYIGQKTVNVFGALGRTLSFIKETLLSLGRFVVGKAIFRSRDFWFIFADCSYKSVGIIALVSFLVGLILAFVGALQLKTFGAEIYVASMVTIGMTRIMAAIMVGIVMAGRTGSSFAATLGTMQVNEEIDALKTLGIKISDYLVAPRLICLVLTIPFLTLLADVLGILGGAVVSINFLDITSTSYFEYSTKALNLSNVLVGLLHSVIYGVIIALSGCYEGLHAGRDADSVGKATTGAVVSALVWMIVATGVLTVILEELNV